MLRSIAFIAVTALAVCLTAWTGEYNVDVANTTSLEAVPAADVIPPPADAFFDASRVAVGDKLWLVTSSGGATVSARRLVVEDNATLNIGFDSTARTSDGFLSVNITDNGERQDFVIGNTSGQGVVNLGNAATDVQVALSGGKLDVVDGIINYQAAPGNIVSLAFDSMTFAKGVITMADADTRLTIGVGGGVIGHGTNSAAQAILNASSGVTFTGGLSVIRGGVLNGNGGVTNIAFGSSGKLTLAGGAVYANGNTLKLNTKTITVEDAGGVVSTLDATGGSIVFAADAAMTVRGNLDIVGADREILLKSYTQTAGAATSQGVAGITVADKAEIKGDGVFQAEYATFTGGLDVADKGRLLHGALDLGAESLLRIGEAAFMDISQGDLEVTGGDGVEIYGTLVIGENSGTVWRLLAGDDGAVVTFQDGSAIELSEDFINRLDGTNYLGSVVVEVGTDGVIVLPGDKTDLDFDNFLYGQYTYALNADGNLVLDSYFTGVERDGTAHDFDWARRLLDQKYGPVMAKSDGFALNIYKSAVRENTPGIVPFDRLKATADALIEGSDAEKTYLMNMANLQAFAKGSEAALDGSLAAMYSGLNNSGVVDVAMSTAATLVDHVKMRTRCLNSMRLDQGETICGTDALPSVVIESDHANRVWVGGLGMLENARTREGMAGYRYEPGGFLAGYDHVIDRLTLGVVYAYAKGDFADKTSLGHDSKIASHSFGVHGTYFAPSGLYVSGMAGYTYSSNDISELRRDASVTGGMSWNQADYNGHTLHAALEIGKEIRLSNGLTLTPAVGVTYIYSELEDHTERLGGVAAGRVADVSNHRTLLPVNLEAAYEICTGAESRLKLTANAGYAYNFDDRGIEGTFDMLGFTNAVTHQVIGRGAGHHRYNLGAGIRFYTTQFDIGVKYDYYGMANYSGHRLMATAGFSF